MANIRRARRSGLVFRGGRNVRETLWIGQAEVAAALPAANSAVLMTSLNAAGLALRPFTVVRERGTFWAQSDQITAPEIWSVAYGKCVVSDQALGIGITAVPTPAIDLSSDLWYLYERIIGSFVLVSTGEGIDAAGGRMITYDGRAMRKVEEGQDLISVVENGSVTADGSQTRVVGRTLVKLH